MLNLELDFTKSVPRYNATLLGALFLLITLVAAFFIYQQQLLSKEIQRKNSQLSNAQHVRSQDKANPDLERQLSEGYQTQRSLNMYWEPMLSALEHAQQENASIKLLSIQPKPEKGELLIAGEASEFDALVKYLNSLRQQSGLGEAVLLNQHWEQSASDENSAKYDKLLFNLSVIWRP